MNIKIEITASNEVLAAVYALARSLDCGGAVRIDGANVIYSDRQVTAEQLREVLMQKSKEVGRNAINQLMAEFGTVNITGLDESRYEEFLSRLQKMQKI